MLLTFNLFNIKTLYQQLAADLFVPTYYVGNLQRESWNYEISNKTPVRLRKTGVATYGVRTNKIKWELITFTAHKSGIYIIMDRERIFVLWLMAGTYCIYNK